MRRSDVANMLKKNKNPCKSCEKSSACRGTRSVIIGYRTTSYSQSHSWYIMRKSWQKTHKSVTTFLPHSIISSPSPLPLFFLVHAPNEASSVQDTRPPRRKRRRNVEKKKKATGTGRCKQLPSLFTLLETCLKMSRRHPETFTQATGRAELILGAHN